MAAADWFLDRDGQKSGPYTAQQVESLLKKGEVQGTHKATAEWLCGEWITVSDLIAGYQAARGTIPDAEPSPAEPPSPAAPPSTSSAPSLAASGFQPPPRPPELNEPSETVSSVPPDAPLDPTTELFDVFQAAKGAKAEKARSAASHEVYASAPERSKVGGLLEKLNQIPKETWKKIGFGAAGVLALWIGYRWMSTPPAATPDTSAPTAQAPAADSSRPSGNSAPGFRAGGNPLRTAPQAPPPNPFQQRQNPFQKPAEAPSFNKDRDPETGSTPPALHEPPPPPSDPVDAPPARLETDSAPPQQQPQDAPPPAPMSADEAAGTDR